MAISFPHHAARCAAKHSNFIPVAQVAPDPESAAASTHLISNKSDTVSYYTCRDGAILANDNPSQKNTMLVDRLASNIANQTPDAISRWCKQELALITLLVTTQGAQRKIKVRERLIHYLTSNCNHNLVEAKRHVENLLTLFTNRGWWDQEVNRCAAKYTKILVSILECYGEFTKTKLPAAIEYLLQTAKASYIRNIWIANLGCKLWIQLSKNGGSFQEQSTVILPIAIPEKILVTVTDKDTKPTLISDYLWSQPTPVQPSYTCIADALAASVAILQNYDILQKYQVIFTPITQEMCCQLIQHFYADEQCSQYQQHFELAINEDLSYMIVGKVGKPAITKAMPNPYIFNANMVPHATGVTLVLDPNSRHQLLEGNSWCDILTTTGTNKLYKFALQVEYELATSTFKFSWCMKLSHKSRDAKLGLNYLPFAGIGLNNKKARKQFIQQGIQAGNLAERIYELYRTTKARFFDAKLANVLFHPLTAALNQIDDEPGYSSVTLEHSLSELLAEHYPQANAKYNAANWSHQVINFAPANCYRKEILVLPKVARATYQEWLKQRLNVILIDSTNQVYRLIHNYQVKPQIILVHKELTQYNPPSISSYFHEGLPIGFLWHDSFASQLICTRKILASWHSEQLSPRMLTELADQLAPLLFPVAPFNLTTNISANPILIALECALLLCHEAKTEDLTTLKQQLIQDTQAELTEH